MLCSALAQAGAHEAPPRRTVQTLLHPQRLEGVVRLRTTVDDEPQEGWNELPLPSLYPRKHRELLRAIVAVRLGISYYRINLRAIDKAYSIVFPQSTPINVNKKKRD